MPTNAKPPRVPRLVGKTYQTGWTNWYWQPSKSLRERGYLPLRLGAARGLHPSKAIVDACRAENCKVVRHVFPDREAVAQARGERARIKAITRLERRKQWIERQLKLLRDPDSEQASCLKTAAMRSVTTKIYFIAALKGPIKIGLALNPRDRLRGLQTSHPKKLRLLADTPGDHGLEASYHHRFAAHRLHGEWFAPHADILDEIRRIRSISSNPSNPTDLHDEVDRDT